MNDYHDHSKDYYLFEQAVKEKSFKRIIAYNCYLFFWQCKFPQDVKRIATIASHKLNKHNYCQSREKCDNVEKFIQENMPVLQIQTVS